MLSTSELKYIRSLHQKKFRLIHKSILVEGATNVMESLKSPYKIKAIYGTKQFFDENTEQFMPFRSLLQNVSEWDLLRISTLVTNKTVVAVIAIPDPISRSLPNPLSNLVIVLDGINEPGNFGAIIRVADWFGFPDIICSTNTVDLYHPKVIHASMGSWWRVNVCYTDLEEFLIKNKNKNEIYGAVLNGTNIHTLKPAQNGILIIGNESNGISNSLLKYITVPVTIPRFGKTESLNAAVAAGILCDHFRGMNQ